LVHTTIYFAWQTPLHVTNNIPKGLFLYWSYQVFISIGTLLVTFNSCGKPGSSRQVHSNCSGIPQCIQATLAHELRTYFNPCRVDAWYLGTDAAGHIPADSICDVRFLVITMHRVLRTLYIGVNILSTSSAPDVFSFYFLSTKASSIPLGLVSNAC